MKSRSPPYTEVRPTQLHHKEMAQHSTCVNHAIYFDPIIKFILIKVFTFISEKH